ncbi:MAG: PAS domain S-box protein, partial [Flavobacterium sp.]|nr:PAS domain S-box protein [Flavobacterium sp.]
EIVLQSEQRFKALVQEGSDMISIIDANGKYSYTSPTTTAILGITPEEFQGKTIFNFIHPEDIEKAANYMQRIAKEKKVIVEPFRLKDGNNEWRWIETVLTNMTDNPAVEGIVANSRDITKQKEEEQRLRLLSSVVTNTKDSVVITEVKIIDYSGPKIIYVNEAFTKMTGYKADEIIGKTTKILHGPNTDHEELKKLSKAIEKWESCEITIANYKKNGEEFWNNFKVSPVADEKGMYTHWIAIQRDVTEQKQKELEKELLGKISLNFSSEKSLLDSSKLLCQTICEYGRFDLVELWMPNIENTKLQLIANNVASTNATTFSESTKEIRAFKLGEGLPGTVWSKKNTSIWENINKKDDFVRKEAAEKTAIKNAVAFPLIYYNHVVGVLLMATQKESNHLNKHIKLFEQLKEFIGSEINRKKLENDLGYLYDTIPDILCVTDFQGRFLKINKAACNLLGYTEEEILYNTFDKFVHPDDKNRSKGELENITNEEITIRFENRYISKTGKVIWLSWTSNASSEEGLIYATAKNITEEKKLRELNRQTRELAKVGGWEYDLIENKLFWSNEVHRLHETDPNTYIPNVDKAIDFYKEEHKAFVTERITKSITEGIYLDYEAILITKGNKERWIRVIGNPEYIKGKCVKFFGSFQDITDRKEAEARLQNLSDNIPGVVFQYIIHPDGSDEIRNVSKGAEKIWGYTAEEITNNIDLAWSQTKAGGDFEAVKKSIEDSITKKTNWSVRFRSIIPNGEKRVLQGYGKPEFPADGTVLFNSILLDVTQESKNEELLAQATKIAKIGSWEVDRIKNEIYWSNTVYELHEADPVTFKPDLANGINFYREDFREMVTEKIATSFETGIPFDFEAVLVTAKKNERWVRCIGNTELANGECTRLYGSFQDIQEQKENELRLKSISKDLLKACEEKNKILESIGRCILYCR